MTIRLDIARIVADHWRAAALGWGDEPLPGRMTAHPLCLVIDALDGQTDPVQLGIPADHPDAARIRALTSDPPPGGPTLRDVVRGLMLSDNLGDVHEEINRLHDLLGLDRPAGNYLKGWTEDDLARLGKDER